MAEKPAPGAASDGKILVYVEDYDEESSCGGESLRRYHNHQQQPPRVYEGRRCEAESSTAEVQLQQPHHHQPPPRYVAPPYGWKRILANGIVIYISPSNTALSSTEQVKAYLLAEGTCKCGLECPLNCETTFNFNPKVLTRPWTAPVIGPSDLNKLCNHKRKLLAQTSIDSLDNKYDGFRKKKRKFIPSLPQGLLPQQGEQELKDQEKTSFNGLPWRANNNSQEFIQESYSNGYQPRYEIPTGTPQYKDGENRFGSPHSLPSNQNQLSYEPRSTYSSNIYENKIKYSQPQETQQTAVVHSAPPTNMSVNRTPPWQQNKTIPISTFDRVPPLHPHTITTSVWSNELKRKQAKFIQKKRYPDDEPNSSSSTPEPPSFLEDPSGYLAQQTALLNSTISRQSGSAVDGVPLPSNARYTSRPKCNKTIVTSRFPDSSIERRKFEEPSSTLPDKNIDDRGPIQGTTVSTSNRSPIEIRPPENIVTTMASSHTQSSNTITSVLAGKANTATVSINTQGMPHKAHPGEENSLQQEDLRQILVPSPGQLVVANSMLPGQSKPVMNQPTVLLPGPLLLQPTSVVVDGLNTAVQIPQIVGNVVQNQVIDDTSLLSPDSKRKANLKKRKLSPVGSMLLSPGSNNVMVQQQQITAPMLQALTILPGKTSFAGTQQLITTNMLQPLNLVPNFPIQQLIVPAGVGSMVMSDGTILQDTVQLNLLTPVHNTNVFSSNGQNLLAPGMVIRTPNSQSNNKVMQNNQFLSSPNQYVVNNTFGGPVSPMLSVSPNQCNRNQDFLPQNVVVQQPSSSNSTIVQQNTTIVQQTTMVSNQQTQPTHTLNLNQNFILNDKPNFILTSEKQNFILSPNSGDKIIISPDNMRGNFVLGNIDKQNFVINNSEKQNLIINNFDKNYLLDKNNSVSTQTQVASPGLYRESPPDTTTLSPVDQEVTTSLLPTSPESLPMVHCVSSSSHLDDHPFSVDNYIGHMSKSASYSDSSCVTLHTNQDKDDNYRRKMSLIEVPDNANLPDGETVSST